MFLKIPYRVFIQILFVGLSMKTIIIPTDFSSAADNAMHYGAQLAQQLQASVLLLHVYMVPITMNDMPVLMVTAEELKGGAEEGLSRCKGELEAAYPGLVVKTESRLGDVVGELKEMCKEKDPQLVVLGTHGSSEVEKFIFGSNAFSAIKHLQHPIIAVPSQFAYQPIQTLVLAADLAAVDESTRNQIISLLRLFPNSQLHIVHVKSEDEEATAQPPLVQQLQELTPAYEAIQHDNISVGLQNYIHKIAADLLVVLPHEHSMLESWFFKMHTKDIVKNAQVPVLCIHTGRV